MAKTRYFTWTCIWREGAVLFIRFELGFTTDGSVPSRQKLLKKWRDRGIKQELHITGPCEITKKEYEARSESDNFSTFSAEP